MSLLGILNDAKKVRDALKEGRYVAAWQATIPLQQQLIDLASLSGFQAGPEDMETCQELKGVLAEIDQLKDVLPVSAVDEVHKIGDGKILKVLIEFIVKVGPIIIPLLI